MTARPVVLVTGAAGFVGSALARHLRSADFEVRATVRAAVPASLAEVQTWTGAHLEGGFNWTAPLRGCDVVLHTAARVHVMRDAAADRLAEFRRANVTGTLRLAGEAARAGVRRFVFVSSVKVNGERTMRGKPFTPDDTPAPADPYGVSKHEAELGLFELAAATGLEVTIVRPVLVYGPGVKGNFGTLLRWLSRGAPLPLAKTDNRRSLVYLENLVELLSICAVHERAANEVFLVRDDDDLATSELLRRMGASLGRRARLFPCPRWALLAGAAIVGQSAAASRLLDSLQVDDTRTRDVLGWRPRVSVDAGLRETARWYLASTRS